MNLTLFVPLYNEEKRPKVGEYISSISQIQGLTLVLVNDGSSDDTLSMLELFKGPNIKIVDFPTNQGKGEALRKAMREHLLQNEVEIIGYLDCDGAFPKSAVVTFLRTATEKIQNEKFQVCIASRIMLSGRDVVREAKRHYISRILITLIGFRYSFMPYDSQSGLKIFRVTQALDDSLKIPFRTKWLFDIELLNRLDRKSNEKLIWEEPVMAWADKPGSHLRLRNFANVFKEVVTLYLLKAKG
jgi:glycosyltransferase involved in cell wall biosynthesis